VVQLPWVEFFMNGDGLVNSIRCIIYSKIESRKKLLIPKLDFLLKHSRMRKTTFTILGVKVGKFYETKKCAHKRKSSSIYPYPF
jgi:hypothetical protein